MQWGFRFHCFGPKTWIQEPPLSYINCSPYWTILAHPHSHRPAYRAAWGGTSPFSTPLCRKAAPEGCSCWLFAYSSLPFPMHGIRLCPSLSVHLFNKSLLSTYDEPLLGDAANDSGMKACLFQGRRLGNKISMLVLCGVRRRMGWGASMFSFQEGRRTLRGRWSTALMPRCPGKHQAQRAGPPGFEEQQDAAVLRVGAGTDLRPHGDDLRG